MSTRDKNDINYFKFLELSKAIKEDDDPEHIIEETYRIFKPKNVNRFAAALERDGRLKRRFKLDLDFRQAGRFIDADTYRQDGDMVNMFRSLLVPRRKWYGKKYKIEELSLREGEYYTNLWEEFLADIKLRYEYIYNPPLRYNGNPETQGSIERREFAEHYGGYAEMTYLIANGMVKDFKDVWNWDLDYFLFWGEYLLRKRDVENIK